VSAANPEPSPDRFRRICTGMAHAPGERFEFSYLELPMQFLGTRLNRLAYDDGRRLPVSRMIGNAIGNTRPLLPLPQLFRVPIRLMMVALALAVVGLFATEARAEDDAVHFGDPIQVAQGESVHNAVCFFCSVRVDGEATENVVSFFGDVRVRGDVRGNVVNFFGDVRLDEDAAVGGDTVEMFGRVSRAGSASIGGQRVVMPAWIFWVPFLLLCLGIAFIKQEIRMARRQRFIRGY
jgi:hypothetical protein